MVNVQTGRNSVKRDSLLPDVEDTNLCCRKRSRTTALLSVDWITRAVQVRETEARNYFKIPPEREREKYY